MSQRRDVIPGMCFVIPLDNIRNTPSVHFDSVPYVLNGLSAIDRVEHQPGAQSPSVKDFDGRPWYMHPFQEDNLMVFDGLRIVDLYTTDHGKLEQFEVRPSELKHNGEVIHDGPCIFGWFQNVFHRVESPEGSMSVNFARHFEGFDINTNFNIYSLNLESGEYDVLREGKLDQPVVQMGE